MKTRDKFIFKKGGTTLYLKRQYGDIICYDIDISSDCKIVYFYFTERFSVELKKVKKSFPWVTDIFLCDKVDYVNISNVMFPNVSNTIGRSSLYDIGTDVLCSELYGVFSNSFCKKTFESVYLNNIYIIETNAFEGCMTNNIINNTGKSITYYKSSFYGYKGEIVSKKGVLYIGDLVYDIDINSDVVDLPTKRYCSCARDYDFSSETVNELILHDLIPSFYKLNSKKIKFASDFNYSLLSAGAMNFSKTCECFEFDENAFYTSIDGIVYTKDKKTLIMCPKGKTGTVVIEPGTEKILSRAFAFTSINKVIMPDTMKEIEKYAFANSNISEIDLNHSNTKIEATAFYNCKNLKTITIPKEMNSFQESSLLCFDEINLETNAIPDRLIKSIATYETVIEDYWPYETVIEDYWHCTVLNLKNGKKICVPKNIPKKMMNLISDAFSPSSLTDESIDRQHLFKYSKDTKDKYVTAIQTYIVNGEQDNETKLYLRRNGANILKMFWENDKEELFTRFVRFNILNSNSLKRALDYARDKNWCIAISYLMNSTSKMKNNNSLKL